jgi:FixJ family two-component response regulator
LLLLDFAMPGMNGAEVAEQARAARPDLPVIFISGYADSAAMGAALDGRALVLAKPVDSRVLLDAIASATANAASR